MPAYDYSQLPLNISVREEQTFANFIAGENRQVLASLQQQLQDSGERLLYLYGNSGSGVSHLLQAACHYAGALGAETVYLPLEQILHLDVALLEGVEHLPLVCLDDIDLIAGKAEWELALFNLFNRIHETGNALLLGAVQRPAELGLELADLVSRLTLCTLYRVAPLQDADKIRLLEQNAQRRGLKLAEGVARFIVNRSSRDVKALLETLERLDRKALAAGNRLTIPFIKDVMKW